SPGRWLFSFFGTIPPGYTLPRGTVANRRACPGGINPPVRPFITTHRGAGTTAPVPTLLRRLSGVNPSMPSGPMTPDPSGAASLLKPTRRRFIVMGFLCVLSFLTYFDRVCIVRAQQDIQADLGISD